jgi:sugar lactone lactonase YvrE
VTAPGERKIYRVSSDKTVTTLAENFEADRALSKGPNDLIVAPNRSVYFTDPNGFYGESPPGTVYRLSPEGKVAVFDNTIVGPNGITISQDAKTIFVSHNSAKSTARIERWPLQDDGSAGPKSQVATVENCVADGIKTDREGNIWLTCYSFGTAYLIGKEGQIIDTITTEQKALTNCLFGRAADRSTLYLTSSDMERTKGYVYRAKVAIPGFR